MEAVRTVSVIVSAYNEELYIRQCLDSLLGQTLEGMEIIVVNDASTDSTSSILAEYEARFPAVQVIHNQENMRQGGARNLGFLKASGEYVAYCDADDWVDSTMYEKLYRKAVTENCDCVGCYYWKHHENGDASTRAVVRGWGRIYRRSLILENRLFFPEHIRYEDVFFQKLLRYYLKSDCTLPEYLYHYRSHPNSTTHSLTPAIMFERETIELLILDALEERGLETEPFSPSTNIEFLSRYVLGNIQAWVEKVNAFPDQEHLLLMRETVRRRLPRSRKYASAFHLEGRLLLFLFFHSLIAFRAAAKLLSNSTARWGDFTKKE